MNKPFILVVEDNEIQRKVIRLLSLEYGFETVFAANSQDALHAYAIGGDLCDLVLMDLRLPDGSGTECAAQMRKSQSIGPRKVPIVAMTGYIDANNKERCTEMGFEDCLIKPFSANEFRDIVLKWTRPDYNVLPFKETDAFLKDSGS